MDVMLSLSNFHPDQKKMKLSVYARGEEMIYPRVLNDEIKFHARIEFLSISIAIISSFGFRMDIV